MLKSINIFLFILVLIGCSDGMSEKQKLAAIEKDKAILAFTCEGESKHNTPIGDLHNNILNAELAAEFDWTQCLAMRTIDATTQYGWYWQWPEDSNQVYAQPKITLGNSPWLKHNQTKPGYPIFVEQLKKLNIDYSIEILTDGELTIATTLWLTHSDTIPIEIDKSSIAAEVMIRTYASDDFYTNPVGEKVDEILINGVEWEVWVEPNWHDTSRDNNLWVFIEFRATQPLLEVKFDAAEMLAHVIEQSFIRSNLYIADIQLGTQIMSGTGQVWLNHYRVDVVPNNANL